MGASVEEPATQPAPATAPAAPSLRTRIVAGVVTLAVIVLVFVVIFPQFADYGAAWDAIQQMSAGAVVALIVATVVNVVVYVWPFQAALPGLSFRDGFTVRQTSFMISNVVPAGGAIGLAVQYRMLHSFGIAASEATAGIGVTATWNMLVTIGLPVLSAILLLLSGTSTGGVIAVAAVGTIVVGLSLAGLVLVFRSEHTARRLGALAERIAQAALRLVGRERSFGFADALVRFRESTVDIVVRRWVSVTATSVLLQLAQFGILYAALVGIEAGGAEVAPVEALAAFAFARLASFVPITPGGLGTVDAAMASLLTVFGAANSDALAAVLVWRALTLFPQVLIGLGSFLLWRRRTD